MAADHRPQPCGCYSGIDEDPNDTGAQTGGKPPAQLTIDLPGLSQLDQRGHEISKPRYALSTLFLPQADRLQHEAFWIQPECSEVIRTILGEHLRGMNYFRSQLDGFCVGGMHCSP